MWRELVHASGYCFIFMPPALLLAGAQCELYALAIVSLFGVAPLLRIVYGDASASPPHWREWVATALDWMPNAYVVIFGACLGSTLLLLRPRSLEHLQWFWLGLSLWAVFMFASCAAHELLHRRHNVSRIAGRLLSGCIGYPFLEHEHRAHHAACGQVSVPEWPAIYESIWSFTGRRMVHVIRTAWEGNILTAQRAGRTFRGGLPLATASMFATCCVFWLFLGLTGIALYICVSLAVFWAVQAITYLQHWGLGRDCLHEAAEVPFAWEDGCRLQRWLTLSISYHQAHHLGTSVPYYRQSIEPDSPRMPGGYVVLLIASLIPPVWRALMLPALAHWKAAPRAPVAPGRRLLCIVRKQPAMANPHDALRPAYLTQVPEPRREEPRA